LTLVILSEAKNPAIVFVLSLFLPLSLFLLLPSSLLFASSFCFFVVILRRRRRICFALAFALSLASTTSVNHALNPTKTAVISTGAKRTGEIRFSTPAANPPS
jgi:hypothetical protein